MKLREYCEYLGWNTGELARRAGIDRHTAARALFGKQECSSATARKIAEALSKGLGKDVFVGDLGCISPQGEVRIETENLIVKEVIPQSEQDRTMDSSEFET
jgi:transcriptional regulator with XRE-family HTH domain